MAPVPPLRGPVAPGTGPRRPAQLPGGPGDADTEGERPQRAPERRADALVVEDGGQLGGPLPAALGTHVCWEPAAGGTDEPFGRSAGRAGPGSSRAPWRGPRCAMPDAPRRDAGGLGELEAGDAEAFPGQLVVLAWRPAAAVAGAGPPTPSPPGPLAAAGQASGTGCRLAAWLPSSGRSRSAVRTGRQSSP